MIIHKRVQTTLENKIKSERPKQPSSSSSPSPLSFLQLSDQEINTMFGLNDKPYGWLVVILRGERDREDSMKNRKSEKETEQQRKTQ